MENKKKKILKVLVIVLVAVALFILIGSFLKKEANGAWPMRDRDEKRLDFSSQNPADQYVFPYDANETGKLAIKVNNLDDATGKIKEIAGKQNGEVVYYEINGATSEMRNGTMVVKVPSGNFQQSFSELKNVANLVVQESITKGQNIPQVCPMAATQPANIATDAQGTTVKSDMAIYPLPTPCSEFKQNEFSYIKVIFVADEKNKERMVITGLKNLGIVILVVVAVKILVTLFLIGFLIYLIMRFFRHIAGCHSCKHKKEEVFKREVETKPLRKISKVAVKRKAIVKLKSKK